MSDDFETIQLHHDGAVATIALHRPDKYNAINQPMHKELAAALRLVTRSDARALVITGNGKGFCAGQDLTEFDTQDDTFRVDDHIRGTFNKLAMGLRELELPVIAAVNGVAAGAGASLALACDLRLCSDRAMFMQAFIKIGLLPDTGSTWFLSQLVGVPRALELAWTGVPVGAEQAVEMGLANRVVPHDELMTETMAFAQHLAAQPTRAIALTKRAIYRAATTSLPEALEYEAQLQQAAIRTSDHREGIAAFLEKREPAFSGR